MARGIGTGSWLVGRRCGSWLLPSNAPRRRRMSWRVMAPPVTGAGAQEPLVEEVIVLATPYEAALEVASARRDELAGKVVADITNPVDWAGFDGLVTPAGSSGAEEIAKLATGVRVVKAFNTTFAGTLQAGEVADHQLDVLIAGDDADAKTQVAALGSPGGCGPSTPVLCAGPASSNSWGSCTWRAGGARRRIRQHHQVRHALSGKERGL